MKIPKVNFKKIRGASKKLPEFVATHAFLFFFFLFSFEAFLGFHLYHRFCFPEVSPSKSSLKFDKSKFQSAVEKIDREKEELEKISDKDYFRLFSLEPVEEAPPEETEEEVD